MLNLRTICTVFLCATMSVTAVFAQAVSATIVGAVTDTSGAVVANAKVTLTETNTGVDRANVTNASGNFTYPNLPPGAYRVTVEMPGFKKEVHGGINLAVDSTARADVQLTPGNVSETIEVTAEAAVLKTDRADITTTVDAVQIQELPNLFNGNYQIMLSLVPGVSEPTEQHSQFFNASSSVQMNTYGQPRMANNYQIEGIDNNERTGLLQIMIPPKEAIQQVNVSTSNHDPELGRGTGAVSNVVLKSRQQSTITARSTGICRTAPASARTFFNPSVGHIAYNQVGGNIGGPIKKNKLFYFTDYLKTMDHEANTNQTSVPSMPLPRRQFQRGHHPHRVRSVQHRSHDRQRRRPHARSRTISFPRNRINPVAAKIFALMPAPNEPFQTADPDQQLFRAAAGHQDHRPRRRQGRLPATATKTVSACGSATKSR